MKQILTIFSLLPLFISCDPPGTDILYEEAFLEVDAATTVTGEKNYTYPRIEDGLPTPCGFIVTLAAVQQDDPVTFSFNIAASSSAVENLHYKINSTSATIAPNTSTTELPIDILDDNINPGETWTIVVGISSTDVPVNPNYQSGKHIIQVL